MDSRTLLDLSGGSPELATKTIVFKGPQTASTVLHFVVPWDCYLSYVQFSVAGFLCSKVSKTYASLVASVVDLNVVAFRGNSEPNTHPWIGNEEFAAGDMLFFDSTGSMGAADTARFVFRLKPVTS